MIVNHRVSDFRWSRMSKAHAFLWESHPDEVAPYDQPYASRGAARPSVRTPTGGHDPARRDWSAALDAIARAAHQHHARKEELRELETRVHDRLTRLETELVHAESRAQAAERRAQDAERRAAEAEEWLQRMYERINEHFGIAE